MPLELLARIPPIMQAPIEAGSGPILTPNFCRCRLTWPPTIPGWTRTRLPSSSTRRLAPVARDDGEDAVGHGLTRQAGPRGAKGQRDPQRAAEPEQILDLADRGRQHDGLRDDAVDAGVVGKGDAIDPPGQHPPRVDDPAQVVTKSHQRTGYSVVPSGRVRN